MRALVLITGLSFGLYFILADRLKIPYLKVSKAIMNMGRSDRKLTTAIEAVLMDLSMKASKFIPMDVYKKNRLQNVLTAAGIKMTPECYQANAIIKALFVGLLIFPCLLVFPLLSAAVLVLAVLVYFKEYQKAEKQMQTRREEIESELTRFVLSVEQELRSSRDVLSILESYKKNTTPAFAEELGITCADMRSGGYEVALMRLEARINSPQLSDVVRGLIAVVRGDNGVLYFQMLAHDFKCFLATYLVVITVQVIQSIGMMF